MVDRVEEREVVGGEPGPERGREGGEGDDREHAAT
jgi:hypothetical protein